MVDDAYIEYRLNKLEDNRWQIFIEYKNEETDPKEVTVSCMIDLDAPFRNVIERKIPIMLQQIDMHINGEHS
jgi:hypothetical protein